MWSHVYGGPYYLISMEDYVHETQAKNRRGREKGGYGIVKVS